jgi:condensin complex subunit 1
LAEVEKQRRLYAYLEDAIGFMTQISRAVPTLCRLLGSKVNSDITETIKFFVRRNEKHCIFVSCLLSLILLSLQVSASQFKIANAQDGVRKMLPLIWSKDTEIKDAVTEAYETLLIGGGGEGDSKQSALALAKKLIG